MKSIVTPRNFNIYPAFSFLLSSLLAGIKRIIAGLSTTSQPFFWSVTTPTNGKGNKKHLVLFLLALLSIGGLKAATITSNATGSWSATAWPNTGRTGTITTSTVSITVNGTGTLFLSEISVGNIIKTTGNVVIGTVASIISDTQLTLTGNAASNNTNIAFNFQGVGPGDDVVITGNFTVTLDRSATCKTLQVNAAGSNGTSQLTVGAFTLTVTGNVSMNGGGNGNRISSILFNNASSVLSVGGSLTIGNGGSGSTARFDMSNGGANPASNLIIAGSMSFNATDGTFTSGNASTVNYTGASPTVGAVTYRNLIISGSGTPTMTSVATVNGNLSLSGTVQVTNPSSLTTVGGNLTIGDGTTLSLVGVAITVTGTTTVGGGTSGTLNTAASATGLKTFTGAVTINSGGTWNLSGQNPTTSFGGGITMNGSTFNNGSGTATFSATQSLQGSGNMTFGGALTITGTLTNSNTGTVMIGGSPTGNFTQGTNSNLILAATAPSGTFDASINLNTVNYSGASPTVKAVTYRNLTLSGSGTPVMTGVSTVNGNFSLSGSVTATPVITTVAGNISITGTAVMTTGANNVVTGSLTVGSGATLRMGGFSLGIGTTSSITGTVNTVTPATGTKTFTGAVTINSGGVWDLSTTNPATSFAGGITMSGTTFNNGTGAAAFSANQSLLGSGNMTFGGTITPAGSTALTNSNTGTVSVSSTGSIVLTGNFTQGTNAILSLAATTPFSGAGAFDASANANTVNYAGAAQNVRTTSYRNLALSGSGNKTFGGAVTISGDLSISGTAVALLAAGPTISDANTLTLGGSGTANGSWGGTPSAATNIDGTYFGSSTNGIVNITTSTCTAPNASNFSAPSSTTVCAGSGSVVTVNSTSLATGTYTVTYNVSGTNTVSSTTSSMSFTSGSPGTFTTAALNTAGASNVVNITAIAFTSTPNCKSTVSASTPAFTTNVRPTPSFTAQAGASACQGVDVTYTTQTGSGETNYVWGFTGVLNTGYSITSGGTSLDNTVTLKWLTTGSKTATINYTNSFGCAAASPTSSTATSINATPTITLAASAASICYGTATSTTLTYSATTGSPNQYSITWNASPANTLSSVTNAALPASPITISIPANHSGGTYTGNLTVRNSTTNCVSSTYTFTLTINNDVTGLTASASAQQCTNGGGVLVTLSSSRLTNGSYDITWRFNDSGGTTGATVTFSGGTGTFTTSTPSVSDTYVTIKSVSLVSSGCSSGTITVNSNTFTVSAPPNAASNNLTTSASGTDTGNLLGSTITIISGQLAVGTYIVGYTVTDAATNTTIYINTTQSITFVNSTKKARIQGSFTTGQLTTAGSYRININSITSPSTGCVTAITGEFATFSVVNSIFTTANGLWDGTGVWSSNPTGGNGPDYTAGNITINNQVTYDATAISLILELDQLTIGGTGELIIASGQEFRLKDGSGVDITIQSGGKLTIGSASLTAGDTYNGTLVFETGVDHSGTNSTFVTFRTKSLYQHLNTSTNTSTLSVVGGTPPLATWAADATISVEGYTSTLTLSSTNWSQNFANFTWNCPLQTGDINLNGLLGALPTTAGTLQGNVNIVNTGTGILRFGNSGTYHLTVPSPGSFTVSNAARFSAGPSSGQGTTAVLNLNNFTYGSTASSWLCEAGQATVNVAGNITVNSGTVYLSNGGNNIDVSGATINLAGNLTVASGAFLDASSANNDRIGMLKYNNLPGNAGKPHTHTVNGTIVGHMLYVIEANQTVTAVGESPFYSLRATAGTFTMNPGSRLIVESTHANGAIQPDVTLGVTPPAAGNLRIINAARSFAVGSVIEYGRTTAAAQFINGAGHPISTGVNCIINNTAGVSVVGGAAGTVTIGGSLDVVAGNLAVQGNNLTVLQNVNTTVGNIIVTNTSISTERTLRVDGTINMTGGNIQFNSSLTDNAFNTSLLINGDLLSTSTGNFTFSGNNCQVTVGGSTRTLGRAFPIGGPTPLEQLRMNSAGTTLVVNQNLTLGNFTPGSPGTYSGGLILDNGNVDMEANLIVTTVTTLVSGILYFDGNRTVELRRNINTAFPAGVFSSNNLSTMNITSDFGGVANILAFAPSGNTIGTLTLNRTSSDSPHVTLNSALTVSGTFNLTNGEFLNQSNFLSMGNGATIVRTPDAAFTTLSSVPTGPYNLIYNNGLLTSLNTGQEAQGSLNNVTSNLTGTSPNGTVTLTIAMSGIGALTVNSGGTWTSNANAIAIGSLLNAGTMNAPSSTLTLTGIVTPNNIFTNNNAFAHSNGTVIFDGTTTIGGSSVTNFNHLTLNATKTLIAPALIRVSGNINFGAGTFTHSNGNVELNGSTDQSITCNQTVLPQSLAMTSGTAVGTMHFYTITVNKTGGAVNLSTPLKLGHLLELQSATTVNSGGNLILLSQTETTDMDARIGRVLNGGSIIGAVQVQRFKAGNLYEDYKYIGSPAKNIPFLAEMWRLNRYNASIPAWVKTYENMNPGVGYAAQTYASTVRLTFTGDVHVGSFTWSDLNPNPNLRLKAGWNLIANPFPSAIRWPQTSGTIDPELQVTDESKWVLTNVSSIIGITDNNVSGYPSYFRYLNANGSWGAGTVQGNVIAMGQAFWVWANGPGASLELKEGAKVIDSYGTGRFYREKASDEPEQLIVAINNGKVQDHSILRVDTKATEGFEFNMDLPKLWNERMNVFLLNSAKDAMLINALASLREDSDIPVGVKVAIPGDYEFQFSNTSTFRYANALYLVDLQEGVTVPVSGGERYSFSIRTANQSITNRFYLTLNPTRKLMGDATVSFFPNPVQHNLTVEAYGSRQAKLTLLDLNGHILSTTDFRGVETLDMSDYPAGMYVLKVKTDNGIHTHKVVKK